MKWPNSQDKSPSAYLDGRVVCEVVDDCELEAPFSVGVAEIAACDFHAGVEWHEQIRARRGPTVQLDDDRPGDLDQATYDRLFGPPEPGEDDYLGDRELRDLGDRLQAEDDRHDAGECDPASCPVCAEEVAG